MLHLNIGCYMLMNRVNFYIQDKLTPRECAEHNRHVTVVGWLDSIKSMHSVLAS